MFTKLIILDLEPSTITTKIDCLVEIFDQVDLLVLQNNELENVIPDSEIKYNIKDHAAIFYCKIIFRLIKLNAENVQLLAIVSQTKGGEMY